MLLTRIFNRNNGTNRNMMITQEKILYHQIHPLKLLTDWGAVSWRSIFSGKEPCS